MYIKIKEPYEQTIHIMKVHHETEDCYVCELKKDNSYLSVSKEWVLAKSENLEELCDCFVTKGNKHIVWDKEQIPNLTFERLKESYPSWHFEIYGCIWTSKGLIYVAKMNEKGELCLL